MALEKVYDPRAAESAIYQKWKDAHAFASDPQGAKHKKTFCIVIPPPNVTGALHLGHALNNTLQDILVRWHRMRGFRTLWQPGTDHAGIATQAVVERRIRETEGLSRHDLGRDELVRRIWQWKDEYEKRILSQLELMGCSCDWSRTRFTFDEGLSRAVRHIFFRLFKDGLIFRGNRLVNWDTQLQTAVADDEVYHETVKGHFWKFKYPVIDPKPGEPEYVVIATTRPETMLADVAVAAHPDPAGELDRREAELRARPAAASGRERAEIEKELEKIAARRESHLPLLKQLAGMAREGRKLRLPLMCRVIPLIADEWADPMLGTGCVKITPAHDPNDYEVGRRHRLPMINILTPDGKIAPILEPAFNAFVQADGSIRQISGGEANPRSGEYEGLAFSAEGRAKVVADMESRGLIEAVEDREIELGHSDRSKTPIEPYLSDQWFIRTGDLAGKTGMGSGETSIKLADGRCVAGLAQAAMDEVVEGRIEVHPARYAKSYLDWLGEKRDWCISRQLWWGHRIPVWYILGPLSSFDFQKSLGFHSNRGKIAERLIDWHNKGFAVPDPSQWPSPPGVSRGGELTWPLTCRWCFVPEKDAEWEALPKDDRIVQDSDVLDTWFSSALWPFSTLGWPDLEDPYLKTYYPTTVLCTSRDIITNWVARMVMFGLYAMGRKPFDHVYIHPKILDGRGETMSKSKGNGVDPVDVIHTHGADALRYTMADMTTETQDIRMVVEYICPHCGKLTDQGAALKAETQARKSRGVKLDKPLQPADCAQVKCAACGRDFATQWAPKELKEELGQGRETSDKFDQGRNFCNKLWNAARFALMNLEESGGAGASEPQASACATAPTQHDASASKRPASSSSEPQASACAAGGRVLSPISKRHLLPEDRWILSLLSQACRDFHAALSKYQFSAAVKVLREFFWDGLCDWYIELVKPRLGMTKVEASDAVGESSEGGASARTEVRGSQEETELARRVLAFCLDQSLRLWHPIMPFITEAVWAQLAAVAPQRGLPGLAEAPASELLILAAFPPTEGYPALDDPAMLKVFADLQEVVRAVRDLRQRSGVSPRERVEAIVVLPLERIEEFKRQAHVVERMAGVSRIKVTAEARRPPNAGSIRKGAIRVHIPGISDDEAERKRAAKELEQVEKQVKGKESKLANEKFVASADPEIVQAERDRLAEFLAQREALKEVLAELGA